MRERVVRNTAFLLALQVFERGAAYLFLIYITRRFGSELFGTYITAGTFALMAGNIVDFGLYNVVVRAVSQNREGVGEYLGRLFPLRLLLSLGAVLVVEGAAWLLGFPGEIVLLAGLATLSVVVGVPGGLLVAGLNAREEIHISALCSMAGSLLTTGAGILALHWGWGLAGVFAGWAVAAAGTYGLLAMGAARVGIRLRPRWDPAFLLHALREAAPFAVMSVALLGSRMDVLLLSRFHGPHAVGLYGAARRPLEILLFLPGSLMGALYPVLARQYAHARDRLWSTYLRSLHLLMGVAVPLAAGLILLRERLLVALFGEPFRVGAEALPYLAMALAVAFLSAPDGNVIFSAGRTARFVPYFVGNAVLTVLLQLLLIPGHGIAGAAQATLLGVTTAFLVQRVFLAEIFGRSPNFPALAWRPLAAAGGMGLLLRLGGAWGTLPLVAAGAAAYGGILWLLGGHRSPAGDAPRGGGEGGRPWTSR